MCVFLVFEMVGGWMICLVSYHFVVVWVVVVWVVVFLVVMDEWMDGWKGGARVAVVRGVAACVAAPLSLTAGGM